MKKIILSLLLLFTAISSFSQVKLEARIQFEIKDGYGEERIIPFGDLGVLIMTKRDKAENQQDQWRFQLYDTDLNLIEEETFELHVSFYTDETFFTEDYFYALFRKKTGSFSLMSLNIRTMEIKQIEGDFEKKDYVSDLAVVGNYAYFKASNKRDAFVYTLDLSSERLRRINIGMEEYKSVSIKEFQVLEESNELFVYAEAWESRRESDLFVLAYDLEGNQITKTPIDQRLDERIIDITVSKISEGKYAFTGTYSNSGATVSQGIYFGIMEHGKRQTIKFYNFLDLENFLNYLSDRRAEKIKKKAERKESRGKEVSLNYNIEAHPIIFKDGKYIFLGEAYYATYRTEYTYTTDANGRTIRQSRQVFDGYQYTHAMLAAFDEQGELLWDNIFEMWPSYKPYYAIKFISMAEDVTQSIDLVFSSYNAIKTMSFDFEGEVNQEEKWDAIETENESEEVLRGMTRMVYWYDQYFINYGSVKIKDADAGILKKKRREYFISKLGY